MQKIGNCGVVDKENYKTWPLFYKLRKEEKFKEIYKEIFDEEYTVLEIPQRPIQDLIEEIMKKNTEVVRKTIEAPSKNKAVKKTTTRTNKSIKSPPIK